jgi:transposase
MNTTTAAHIDRSEKYVGIDVGKSMLDVCIFEPDVYLQYPNTPEGIRESLKKLSCYNLTRILVEATSCSPKRLTKLLNGSALMIF